LTVTEKVLSQSLCPSSTQRILYFTSFSTKARGGGILFSAIGAFSFALGGGGGGIMVGLTPNLLTTSKFKRD
jgi:hypothetical protein